jgi:hypothetical protein
MVELPEDTTLDVVDHLIAEAEEHRIEQVALIEHLTRQRQSTTESERTLAEIEHRLAAALPAILPPSHAGAAMSARP